MSRTKIVDQITAFLDLTRRDQKFQDFVIVHELLHLRIRSHGKLFKAMMATHIPNWRRLDAMRTRGEDH